jgi:opine dehydrogenase
VTGPLTIAVLGGGNGSYAAAADMSEAGHSVRLWRQNAEQFAPVLASQRIRLTDVRGSCDVALGRATLDIGEAVRGADLVLAPLPAFAQVDVAKRLAPHLCDGQVIYLPPGTFGAFAMLKELRAQGCTADVAAAETGTLPWLTRKHGPAEVAITTRATRLPTGVFPSRHSAHALEVIGAAFPNAIEPVEDSLSAALMNAGPIIHPPLILMNAGPIEHFERWDIHKEGTQPSIRHVHRALDAERIAIRERLGYAAPHFPLEDHYTSSNWMYGALAHDKLVDSGDWHEKLNFHDHRYLTEDIGYGLALLVSVGRWAGVPVPLAESLLTLGGTVAGRDFFASERTFERLGLASLSRDEMHRLLREGL